jgi:5-methylcytosine-specific restriction endonuclease McrA
MTIQLAYNKRTYGNQETFRRFVEAIDQGESIDRAMRHIWAGKNSRTKLLSKSRDKAHKLMQAICNETCANPRCGRVLDYALGGNIKGRKAPATQPSLDHIVPKSIAKLMGWTTKQIECIENYQILCTPCNTAKNNMWGQEDAERLRGLADMIDATLLNPKPMARSASAPDTHFTIEETP